MPAPWRNLISRGTAGGSPSCRTSTPAGRTPCGGSAYCGTERDYTLDDLARAAMPLMDTHMADLQRLLQSFGVEALPNLPKEQYGAFATALRGMGGRI